MYFDNLKKRVHAVAKAKRDANTPYNDIETCIADCYLPIHRDVQDGTHTVFHLPGGRGSGKSSFISLEIVDGIMKDPEANGIIFRKTAATMRDSVFSQIAWAVDALGVSQLWRGTVSPMTYTYIPTGQRIVFRGLDDSTKLKSIKPSRGFFKYIWFEEFCELTGPNMVRSVIQSVMRGTDRGNGFRIFNSFNPPLSVNSWANKYILIPDDRAIVFKTDYRMIPPEWLGEAFILEAERLQQINPDAYRHEYLGEAMGSGGEVFPNITARKITDSEIDNMQYIYCGIDWGFSVDPFAFLRCSYDRKRQTVYILDEIVKRGLSNAAAADLIKAKGYDKATPNEFQYYELADRFVERKQLIICDSEEPKSIADMTKLGLRAVACKKYPGSVNYGIRWLQSKTIVIDPARTPNAFREFTEYEYDTTKDGEFLASVPDKDNHCIDCCRYALDMLINSNKYSA